MYTSGMGHQGESYRGNNLKKTFDKPSREEQLLYMSRVMRAALALAEVFHEAP